MAELTKHYKKLYDLCLKARENAYAPYSRFKVGAVVLLKDGTHYIGANIENASYSLTICAERLALFSAYAHGVKKQDILTLAVLADTPAPVAPCGACCQVIGELMEGQAEIVLFNTKGEIKQLKVSDLLPYPFVKDDLRYDDA